MRPTWIAIATAGAATAGAVVASRSDETGEIPVLTLDDDGATVHVARNETVTVNLEGNPSTGYTWEVSEIDRWILVDHGAPQFIPSGRLTGGGVLRFRFTADQVGETDVKFVYHRPWDTAAPLQTFTVRVVSG